MNEIITLTGLLLLLALTVHLLRLVACDGRGVNPGPRSHRAELGGWAAQELRR